MAKPTFVNFASGPSKESSVADPGTEISLPADLQAGDLILIFLSCGNGAPALTITDFTLLHNDYMSSTMALRIYYKIATGSEGATVGRGTLNTSYVYTFVSIAYRGAADPISTGDNPYNYAGMDMTYGTGPYSSPASTANVNDSLVLRWAGTRSGSYGATTPTSHTLRLNYAGSGTVATHRIAEQDAAAAAGTVDAAQWTSMSQSNWGTGTLVLEPSASAAPTITSATITGTSQVGQTLTAVVTTNQDPVDSTAYQWEKASDGSGTGAADISGATSSTLSLTYAELGSLLDAGDAYVRYGAIATKDSLSSDETFSDWQEVTIPGGSGVDSPLGTPCIVGEAMNLQDVAAGASLAIPFNTVDPATKAPYTLAGSPAIGVWRDGIKITLESSPSVIVDKENADAGSTAKTGSHWVVLNLSSDSDFTAGADYVVKLTAGTVNSVSVADQTIATFTIENRQTILRDESLTVDKFAANLILTDADIVKKFGVTLAVAAGTHSTTGFAVSSAESLTNTQIDNAVAIHLNSGVYTRITNITGTDVTISPALPTAPTEGEEFVVFAQYLASL